MGENGNWDIEEVRKRQDSYVDPAPVGCGRNYRNTTRDFEKNIIYHLLFSSFCS